MGTIHKAPKDKKYGKPQKRGTGKKIGETSGAMPSTTYGENSRRRMNEARDLAKPHRHR